MRDEWRQATEASWLRAIADTHEEWSTIEARLILRAVLSALRVYMPDDAAQIFASGLSASLKEWFLQLESTSDVPYSREQFLRHVRRQLAAMPAIDAVTAVCVVLKVARYQVNTGHAARMRSQLPRDLQGLWPGVLED